MDHNDKENVAQDKAYQEKGENIINEKEKEKEKEKDKSNGDKNKKDRENENGCYIALKYSNSEPFYDTKIKQIMYKKGEYDGEIDKKSSSNGSNLTLDEDTDNDLNPNKINSITEKKKNYGEDKKIEDNYSDENKKGKKKVNKKKMKHKEINERWNKSVGNLEFLGKKQQTEEDHLAEGNYHITNERKRKRSLKCNKESKELKQFKDLMNGKEIIRASHSLKVTGSNKISYIHKTKSNIGCALACTGSGNHIHHHHHHYPHNIFVHSKDFPSSKFQTFKTRLIWTFILIGMFFLILLAGHFYCSLLVLVLITIVYNEIISLKSIENKDKKLPQIFYIRWYWFVLTIIHVGIPWLIPKLKFKKKFFNYLLLYHSIIMFISAFFGFVWFILSLRKFSLKYQFSQIGIILLCSLLIVTQSLMHIANIYSGLIWFFVPVSSVIVNDIFAYVFGVLFGKTRLIQLSPKKTVEGYVGSSIITILWGILVTMILQKHKFFICPQPYITFKPFETWKTTDCEENVIFQPRVYVLPKTLSHFIHLKEIYYTKMLFHGLVLSLFAAFLAPFGGFFASGFKRALKIKDFGKYIPGHGGVTDRFDCQIFIGMFTYLYMKTFARKKVKVHSYYSVLDSVYKLNEDEQWKLFEHLKNILDDKIETLEIAKRPKNKQYKDKNYLILNDKCYDERSLQKLL